MYLRTCVGSDENSLATCTRPNLKDNRTIKKAKSEQKTQRFDKEAKYELLRNKKNDKKFKCKMYGNKIF